MLSSALLLTTVLWTTTAVSPILSAPIPIIHQIEQEQGVHQVALLSPHLSTTSKERYDGHQVWRVDWADLGAEVKEEILAAAGLWDLDIWRSTPANLDIRLGPHQMNLFKTYLPSSTAIQPFISDLQSLVETASSNTVTPLEWEWDVYNLDMAFHDSYHSLEELYAFGEALVQGYPDLVESFDLGLSEEGRIIKGFRAHCNKNHTEGLGRGGGRKGRQGKGRKGHEDDDEQPFEFIIQSGQHPREWVGPSSAMYFLHWLLVEGHVNQTPKVLELLDEFIFTIVPTINPDGYVYSHEHSRMWRKNRQDTGHKTCSGIDLNGNWGYEWRASKGSPCSDQYPGSKPFEAKEVQAMASYIEHGTPICLDCPDLGKKNKREHKVKAFIDLHSYGQLFMFPFAHSCKDFPHDAEMLLEAGLGVAKIMSNHNDEGFEAGQACALTYRAPGDAIDYTYGTQDVRWSYSVEMRDTGTYGFMLPPALIRPAAQEITFGLEFLAGFIHKAENKEFDR